MHAPIEMPTIEMVGHSGSSFGKHSSLVASFVLALCHGHGQRVAERELGGRRGRRREADRAGLGGRAGRKDDVGVTRQRRILVSGDRNKRSADAFDCGDQPEDLLGCARVGERQHDVLFPNAAKVTMHRLGGVQVDAGGSGGGERRADFLRDDPRFSHARRDHLAFAFKDHVDGLSEPLIQKLLEGQDRGCFQPQDLPPVVDILAHGGGNIISRAGPRPGFEGPGSR